MAFPYVLQKYLLFFVFICRLEEDKILYLLASQVQLFVEQLLNEITIDLLFGFITVPKKDFWTS